MWRNVCWLSWHTTTDRYKHHPIIHTHVRSNLEATHNGNGTPVPTTRTQDNINSYDSDTMTFSYPRYNGEPDVEAHVRSLAHEMPTTSRNDCQKPTSICEWSRNLGSPSTAGWLGGIPNSIWPHLQPSSNYERHFFNCSTKHSKKRDLWQYSKESIADFVICFQNLWSQLTRLPTEGEAIHTFLAALRGPMRPTLSMIDSRARWLIW